MHSKCRFSLQLYSPVALFRQCNLPPCGKIGYIVWNDTTNVFDHAYLCFILFVLHVCLIRCFTIFHFYHTQKFTLFRSVSICSYCCSVQFCIANNGYIKDLCLLLLSPFSHPVTHLSCSEHTYTSQEQHFSYIKTINAINYNFNNKDLWLYSITGLSKLLTLNFEVCPHVLFPIGCMVVYQRTQ